MNFFSHFCLAAFCIVLLAGCVKDKTHVEEKSDVEFDGNVIEEGERGEARMSEESFMEAVNDVEALKIFTDALLLTGLDTTLAHGGPYTLFAPSDKAFESMQKLTERQLPDSIDSEELKKILLHHVTKGSYSAADLVNMSGVATLVGDSLKVIKVNNQVTIDSALIIFADREAENGYVHVIDSVLISGS